MRHATACIQTSDSCTCFAAIAIPGATTSGLTSDGPTRLDWHNAGQNEHTIHDRPWHVLVSLEFRTAEAAGQFERYLKTGSGRAFAKRHFP